MIIMATDDWVLPEGCVMLGRAGEPKTGGPYIIMCQRCRTHMQRHSYDLEKPHGPCKLREDVLSDRIERVVIAAIRYAGTGEAARSQRAWLAASRALGQLAKVGCARRGTA